MSILNTLNAPTASERLVRVNARGVILDGNLMVPARMKGLIIFAHGSGSSRHRPRNRMVAEKLNKAGFSTLLLDLVTREEEVFDLQTGELRFNIDLLAERVAGATEWASKQTGLKEFAVGYFGASTGAAAALVAAADEGTEIAAIVSRGGRPELANTVLAAVRAPTLLIVGGNDTSVIEMNERALKMLRCEKALTVIPGATHLFEEPGALEEVARLAGDWFEKHMPGKAK